MFPLRLAVALHVFAEPLRDSLRSAGRLGVQGVQLDLGGDLQPAELSQTGRRQLLHDAGQSGLAVAGLNFSTRRPFAELTELDSRLVLCRDVMTLAHDLKAGIVTIRVGRIPETDEDPNSALLRDVLNDLARHGNHVGVTVAVTPSRDSAARLREVLASVTAGPIGVNFDPAEFVLCGQAPLEAFRTLKKQVVQFTVRDAVREASGSGGETAVGRGKIDWAEMLALLEEAAYRGWLTIDRTEGDDKPRDVARALAWLKDVRPGVLRSRPTTPFLAGPRLRVRDLLE